MGNMGSWFSKNEKNKILNDKEFISILDELNIKDAILNDTEITNENLIEKISSAIEKKYDLYKNKKPKKHTTDIINDLSKFRDKISYFKNKFIEKNQNIYDFIILELMKLEKIIINLQGFLKKIPNNAATPAAKNEGNIPATSAATPAANFPANFPANSKGKNASQSVDNNQKPPAATPAGVAAGVTLSEANNAAATSKKEANNSANNSAKKEANNAATPAANSAANPEANSEAKSGANPEANPEANSRANAVVKSEANSGANSGANSVVKSEANSRANSGPTPNLKKVNNISADPKEIFKLIQDFESKFFNNFFTKVKKGKIYKTEAKNDTKQEHIFNFLKVLLLYKKLFPNEEKDYIDELIKKYSSLCPKVGDEKCGLTKEKMTLGVKTNTYNSNSQKIKDLDINIKNKTNKNFNKMLKDILPNNKPVNNPNNKIKHENIIKIWKNIEIIKQILDRLKYFDFPEKNNNNKNKIVKTIQQKFLDFIKFLLLFKKIIKDKNTTISSTIDGFIKEYLRRCGTSKDEKEGYSMNGNAEELSKRCKSKKTVEYGRSIYELINFDNQDNVDREFKKLLEIGWKNDEEFNKLRVEFNLMLNKYYNFLDKKGKGITDKVLIE